MSEMYFEDHPTDPDKVIIRKPFPVQFIESEYERGFIDGMQEQAKRSVDRAVNAMVREWVELTDEERDWFVYKDEKEKRRFREYGEYIEQRLKEKNHAT